MILVRLSLILSAIILSLQDASGQFLDHFDDRQENPGWVTATGDGQATVYFTKQDGIGSLHVDATRDKLNIWWAIVRRRISGLDIRKLAAPRYELRVEARIRVSHAPRRVNLHVNHQRTTDFHSHLMEFDIPDTTEWHTISMTTRNFETQPGDSINAHLAMMDWGQSKYRVAIDYFRVDVVDPELTGADAGNPMPYHPPLAAPADFAHHADAIHDVTIDTQFPERNFNGWEITDGSGNSIPLMTVGGTQFVIMRWDVSKLRGKKISDAGLLELTPYNVQRSGDFNKDFGMVRVCEILGGDPLWDEKTTNFGSFTQRQALEQVINPQMIIDDSVTWNAEGRMLFTISAPVLQRLIDGRTKGLAIRPLGAVTATFFTSEGQKGPRLYFNVRD